MPTLLHISASPRAASSHSLAIAHTFLEVLADERPDIDVEHWDLWDGTLPQFGPDAVAGGSRDGGERGRVQELAGAAVQAVQRDQREREQQCEAKRAQRLHGRRDREHDRQRHG